MSSASELRNSNVASCVADTSLATLTNLNALVHLTRDQVVATFDFEDVHLKPVMIDTALLTFLSGLFTVLAVVAVFILIHKGVWRKPTWIMIATTVLMWGSTISYLIASLWSTAGMYSDLRSLTSMMLDAINEMESCLEALTEDSPTPRRCQSNPGQSAIPYHFGRHVRVKACMGTAALTVNVVLGDAIVWWRVWVLYPLHSRLVGTFGAVMVLFTLGTGVLITRDSCSRDNVPFDIGHAGGFGPLIRSSSSILPRNLWGSIATLLSLVTNVLAATLIIYRTWEHSEIVASYLRTFILPRTQVQRTLALLAVSGLLYPIIWIVAGVDALRGGFTLRSAMPKFADGLSHFINGCLVPLIGMYPLLMVVLSAVDSILHKNSTEFASETIVFEEPSSRGIGTLTQLDQDGINLSELSTPYYRPRSDDGTSEAADDGGKRGMPGGTPSFTVDLGRNP